MPRRSNLVLLLAVLALAGCSDSTGPVDTVPRQLYYIAWSGGAYPYPSGSAKLYGSALDGSSPVQVIPDSILARFYLLDGSPPWVARDGRRITVFTGAGFLTVDPLGSILAVSPYPDSAPIYPGTGLSPDGNQLGWFEHGFMMLADVESGQLTRIYFDSLGPALEKLAWSRDGRSVAYVSYFNSQLTGQPQDIRVWTRRFSDGFARPVATLSAVPGSLAWSQNGRWLTNTMSGDVLRVRTDGRGAPQVVYAAGSDLAVSSAWGPGDSLLAIAAGRNLLVLRPDGGGSRVVNFGGGVSYAAWRNSAGRLGLLGD